MRAHFFVITPLASLVPFRAPIRSFPLGIVPLGTSISVGSFFAFREVKGRPKVASNTFDIS